MTIFNNQKVVENSLAARVASLFTVLNDETGLYLEGLEVMQKALKK